MDLSIQDWMFVIVGLLVIVVLLDGYRRAQRARRNQVRLSRNAKRMAKMSEQEKSLNASASNNNGNSNSQSQLGDDSSLSAPRPIAGESPTGDMLDDEMQAEHLSATHAAQPNLSTNNANNKSYQADTADEAIDPLFADPFLAESETEFATNAETVEPTLAESAALEPEAAECSQARPVSSEPLSKEPSFSEPAVSSSSLPSASVDLDQQELDAQAEEYQPSLFETQDAEPSTQAEPQNNAEPEEIIVLNVLAADEQGFAGEDLLHILLACDCRFGEMNIFHRYEDANQQGAIQFSIVNLIEPGTFDLGNIASFATPGVSFFMRLPGPQQPLIAFDAMVDTAKCLIKNLNGELRDEQHSTVTEQTLEHAREKIRLYCQKRLATA